jgi:hypothetical protein
LKRIGAIAPHERAAILQDLTAGAIRPPESAQGPLWMGARLAAAKQARREWL